jgi:hypothetical protein
MILSYNYQEVILSIIPCISKGMMGNLEEMLFSNSMVIFILHREGNTSQDKG